MADFIEETVLRRTTFKVARPYEQVALNKQKGEGDSLTVSTCEQFDFTSSKHRKLMLSIIARIFLRENSFHIYTARDLLIQELLEVFNEIDDELPFH